MGISRYSKPIEQTLEKYVPLPMDSMFQAAKAIQERGDLAQQKIDEVETGLASLEAYAPAQRDFVNNFAKDFRTKAADLLTKYHSNTSDPMFIRESKKLSMQFANDPRLKVIKETNDKIKFNEQAASNLQMQGKLFIKPEFTGVDAKGNLISSVGNVQGVNTLDEWAKAGQIAHQSPELIGNMLTNARNLGGWKSGVSNDVAGQAKLVKAYMQQGMSEQEAVNAVRTNMQGIMNQYGVVSRPDTSFESIALQRQGLNQSASQFQQTRQDRAAENEANRKNALAIAALKAKGNENGVIKAPSFNEFSGRIGAVGILGGDNVELKNSKGKVSTPSIMGSGVSQYGTTDKKITNEVISGNIYDISSGSRKPAAKNISIKNGTLTGYMNVWTYAKDGELITMETPTAKPRMIVENGKTYITKGGKKHEVVEKTVAKYDVFETDPKTDEVSSKTIYKEAAPKDAMREMGYSNAYYEGMGRVKHGSVINNEGKAQIDIKYIKSHITNDPVVIRSIEEAQMAYNAGQATEEEIALLQRIQSFDSRKSTYDNEILPYFMQQSKTKTIVEE